MKQELMDAILETPVIAAVKDDAGLRNALTNENIRVVFVLYEISVISPPLCAASTKPDALPWCM